MTGPPNRAIDFKVGDKVTWNGNQWEVVGRIDQGPCERVVIRRYRNEPIYRHALATDLKRAE